MRMKGHDLGLAGIAIIFPAEGNMVVSDLGQPVVRDGDAVGVAAQITEHMVGPAKGRFGVDDPVGGAEPVDKRGEGLWIRETGQAAMKGQFPIRGEGQELFQKDTSKEA